MKKKKTLFRKIYTYYYFIAVLNLNSLKYIYFIWHTCIYPEKEADHIIF